MSGSYMTTEEFEAWVRRVQADKITTVFHEDMLNTCECGGDAVKAVYHADYCPKYENT